MSWGTQGPAGSIPNREIEALRRGLRGPLVLPGDEAYDAERLGFDLLADPRPDLMVAATRTEDIVAAVRFAASHGLPIAVKSTGHGPSGRSAGGLMISTSRLAHVRVDPEARTAWITAGTRWAQVIQDTVPTGLGPLSGSSSTVGAIGYISGGGHPLMGRAHDGPQTTFAAQKS
jgi:FAD/FMN-containing dehydrogenase